MPLTANSTVAKALRVLRGLDRTKSAELGGDGQDTQFEQAFSNLAHAYLRDKAPTLQKYEVGFQLVERNADNTKAIGIFGFQPGRRWLYVPMFFLNGDLKGHELLYLKDEDQFVPLKENWINEILNKRPVILGDPVDRNPWRHGITPPNLQAFSRPPTKFGMAINPKLLPGVAAFAHRAVTDPFSDPTCQTQDLATFLKKEGAVVVRALCQQLEYFPKLAKAFQDLYGDLRIVKEAVDATQTCSSGVLSEQSVRPAPKTRRRQEPGGVLETKKAAKPDIEIWTLESLKIDNVLSAKEKEDLLRDGAVIRDNRQEASKAYSIDIPFALTNPTETGIYEVLVKPGAFERCLIVIGPHVSCGRKNFATVVRLDGEKNYLNIHPGHLWVKQRSENTIDELQKFIDTLPELTSLETSGTAVHMVIGPRGTASCPFRVASEISGGDYPVYDVSFKDYARRDRPDHLPPIASNGRDSYSYSHDGERIQLTGKPGGTLWAMGSDLCVPAGYKLLTIRPDRDRDDVLGDCCEDSGSEVPPVVPGAAIDLQRAIYDKTAELKVYHSGTEVQINERTMTPLAGMIHLVVNHGLREKQARSIIQEAERKKVCRCRIKYAAQSYPLQESAPYAPGFPEYPMVSDPVAVGAPAFPPQQYNVPVGMPAQDPRLMDPYMPPEQDTMQAAMEAAQMGQKEVFDTTMIGSLLKAVRDDTMIDRHLGDLKRGLDRLGRILFSFYWHGDEFQDRYGKQDMPELEDSLRNAFEQLGDVVLFLKQRTAEPFPDANRSDLSDAVH